MVRSTAKTAFRLCWGSFCVRLAKKKSVDVMAEAWLKAATSAIVTLNCDRFRPTAVTRKPI